MSYRVYLWNDSRRMETDLIVSRTERNSWPNAYVQRPIEFVERNPGVELDAATFTGDQDEVRAYLQAMADAAYEHFKITPRGLEEPNNALKSTERHLEDMRYIAGVRSTRP